MRANDTSNSVSLALLDDKELVKRAMNQESSAFNELVRRHYTRAFRVALGVVRDRNLAEDVTQEAFVKAYTQLFRFAGGSAFYTWLYRIVFNLGIDAVRHRRRQRLAHGSEPDWFEAVCADKELWPSFRGCHPHANAERRELQEQMREAYADLPDIHRSVLFLREAEGLCYEDIAQALGIKKGTVMSRLFHARRAMQEKFRRLAEVTAQEQGAAASAA